MVKRLGAKGRVTGAVIAGLLALVAIAVPSAVAQDADDDDLSEGIGDDAQVAPPSIGADIPVTYFGPPPSEVQDELIGPLQLLRSATTDLESRTTTVPLYQGIGPNGENMYYILTETTDAANAAALGLNHSPKLAFADVGSGVRTATLQEDFLLKFDQGVVDFSPVREVVPGSDEAPFPPASVQPGSVGDRDYSPLVKIENAGGHIYNAPVMSMDYSGETISACDGDVNHDLVHDSVVAICPAEGTVTLELAVGFSFARPVLYMSTDSNDPVAAALEGATLAPGLDSVTVGGDDGAFSAVERIFGFANGPTGADNPQRQGFTSALLDEGGPLQVLGGIPTIATDYSPLWDLNLGEWTQEAIDLGYRSRLIEEFQILGFVQEGWLTGPGGAPYGSTGIIINCPIVERLL